MGGTASSYYQRNPRYQGDPARPRSRGGYEYGSAGPQWDAYWRAKDSAAQQAEEAPLRQARGLLDVVGGGGSSGGGVGISMSGLQPAAGGGGGGTPAPGPQPPGAGVGGVGTGSTRIGGIAPVADIDTSAADAATFGRAKDVAGQTGRASIESLRGLLGETGQLGGGYEGQATRDIVENAAGQVGDVNREQAIQGSQRSFQTALANQQSGLAQRGQDINAQEAQARLALAQTQLQFQQAQQQSQRQLDLLRLVLANTPQSSASLY